MLSLHKKTHGLFFALTLTTALAVSLLVIENKWALAAKCSGENCIKNQNKENSMSENLKDDSEKYRLISILDKWTDIATKTRLNTDFVPGMVTVLYGKDMEARGVRKVMDALELIPGIDIFIDYNGFMRAFVRGTCASYQSVSIKILINNIPVTTLIGRTSVYKIPIEQVERIEVIRGPGSAIYGEFALSGVVNIVTYKEINRIYSNLGIYDTYGLGGIFSSGETKKDLKLNLNLAAWKTDGAKIKTGPDMLYGRGMEDISNVPGPTNEKMEFMSALFTLDYKKSSLDFQWIESDQGDFFGLGYALPPPSNDTIIRKSQWSLSGTQQIELFPSLYADLILSLQKQRLKAGEGYLFTPGFRILLPAHPIGYIEYPDGWIYKIVYEETSFHSDIDLTWKGWDRHTLLFGLSFSKIYSNDLWFETNLYFSDSNMPPIPSDKPIRKYSDGAERKINSLLLQDEFRVNDEFTITASGRYDNYNDIGDRFSPRMAAVYRINERNIVKAQYAKAFRPSVVIEAYAYNPFIRSNPDLKPESIESYELGYIYKRLKTVGRITLFYSRFKDRIFEDIYSHSYKNSDDIYLKGSELEIEQTVGPFLKLDANLSFVKTEDHSPDQKMLQAADWVSNIGMTYKPYDNLTLSVQYRYVGDRQRESLDPRDDMSGYHTVDITGTIFDLALRGLKLSMSIKNLFDQDVRAPAPVEKSLSSVNQTYPTYPEDFPRPGRQWYLQLSCEF